LKNIDDGITLIRFRLPLEQPRFSIVFNPHPGHSATTEKKIQGGKVNQILVISQATKIFNHNQSTPWSFCIDKKKLKNVERCESNFDHHLNDQSF